MVLGLGCLFPKEVLFSRGTSLRFLLVVVERSEDVLRCDCSAAEVNTPQNPGDAVQPKVSRRSATSTSPIT
ncbi:unnamed protein product [Ectocarpus sp. CCAP 1310/34]|nr:unnamed protein product [Ectocarpus sp. CCAP 1310/34]